MKIGAGVDARAWPTTVLVPTVIVVVYLAARGFLSGSPLLAYATVGVALVALLLFAAPFLLGALVLLVAIPYPPRFATISFGHTQITLLSLGVFALGGWWITQVGLRLNPVRLAFKLEMSWYALALAQGATVAALAGSDRGQILGPVLVLALPLVCVPAQLLLRTRELQEAFVTFVVRVATAVSAYLVSAVTFGLPIPKEYFESSVVTLQQVSTTQRLRPGGLAIVFFAIVIVMGRGTLSKFTWSRRLQLLILSLVIAFSFNRSTWIGLVVAIGLLRHVLPKPPAALRQLRVIVAAVGAAGLLYGAASGGALGAPGRDLAARIASTTNGNVTKESSLRQRGDENQNAIQTLGRSPLFGTGVARPYGAKLRLVAPVTGRVSTVDRLFIHNSFLGIWLQLGLAGVVALLATGMAAGRSMRHTLATQPDRLIPIAATCTLAGLAAQSLFQTSLQSVPTMFVFGLCLTLVAPRDAALTSL